MTFHFSICVDCGPGTECIYNSENIFAFTHHCIQTEKKSMKYDAYLVVQREL